MGWILAFLTATLAASHDIFLSRERLKKFSGLLKSWLMSVCTLPVLVIALCVSGIPVVQPRFWIYASIQVALLSVAQTMYLKALSLGPISQTQPILGLTTILLTVTNPIMTQDAVSPVAWIGVVMVGVGIYASQHPGPNEDGSPAGFFAPFVEMWRQPGVKLKLGVTCIFSVTANMDRLGVETASGPFYLVIVFGGMTVVQGIALLVTWSRNGAQSAPRFDPQLLVGGGINAAVALTHMGALVFLPVPYVIATKRISIVLASVWGYAVRRERKPHWYRLLGVLLVVAGIAFILLLSRV